MTAPNLLRLAAIAILLTTGLRSQQPAQLRAEDCAGCHDSGSRIGKREAGVPPGYNAAALKASPHAALDCVACHSDIKEAPHPVRLKKVDCGSCHGEEQTQYSGSVHGKKKAQNDAYGAAPEVFKAREYFSALESGFQDARKYVIGVKGLTSEHIRLSLEDPTTLEMGTINFQKPLMEVPTRK